MRQFLVRGILFGVIALGVAFVCDYVVSRGLRETRHREFAEWNDIFDGAIHADVVVSGSSRAYVQVDPVILDSLLKCTSYNLGMDGSDFLLQSARMSAYLKFNQTPAVIIQILDARLLEKLTDIFQYEQFFPYFYDSALHQVVRQYATYLPIDYRIPFLRYRNQHRLAALGLLEYLHLYHIAENRKDRGYAAVEQTWDSSFYNFTQQYPEGYHITIHPDLARAFENFLQECKTKNVTAILVYAPEYRDIRRHIINRDSVITMYRNFSTTHGVPLLDYSDSMISSNKNYFYNSQHLNKTGAEKFSRMLARDVKKIINGNVKISEQASLTSGRSPGTPTHRWQHN